MKIYIIQGAMLGFLVFTLYLDECFFNEQL